MICLEIEQKFLFDQQVILLRNDIEEFGALVDRNTVEDVRTGLVFNELTNHYIRMLFIDVLTRRYLLRNCALLKMI